MCGHAGVFRFNDESVKAVDFDWLERHLNNRIYQDPDETALFS